MTLPTRVSWYGRYRGCIWYKKFGKRKKSFREKLRKPDFRSIFGHQRAKNEGTNTKIDRGPETYPISINPRDEMNRADSFPEKLRKPRFSVNFWPPEGQKWGHEHENRLGSRDLPHKFKSQGWNESSRQFSRKVAETPIFGQLLATRGPKMRAWTRKSIGVQRLTP